MNNVQFTIKKRKPRRKVWFSHSSERKRNTDSANIFTKICWL